MESKPSCCFEMHNDYFLSLPFFDLLNNVEKTSYVLGSEHWEKNFKSLLFLVKEYFVDVWKVRKQILYGDDSCPSHLQSQSSVGDLGGVTGVDGHRSGELDKQVQCKCTCEYMYM